VISGSVETVEVFLSLQHFNPLLRSWCLGDGLLLAMSHAHGNVFESLCGFEQRLRNQILLRTSSESVSSFYSNLAEELSDAFVAKRQSSSAYERCTPPRSAVPSWGPNSRLDHLEDLEELGTTGSQDVLQCPVDSESQAARKLVAARAVKSQAAGKTCPPRESFSAPLHSGSAPLQTESVSYDAFDRDESVNFVGDVFPAFHLGHAFSRNALLQKLLRLATDTSIEAANDLMQILREQFADPHAPMREALRRVMVATCLRSQGTLASIFMTIFRKQYIENDGSGAEAGVLYSEWGKGLKPTIHSYLSAAVAAACAGNLTQMRQLITELVWLEIPSHQLKLLFFTVTAAAVAFSRWNLLRGMLFPGPDVEGILPELHTYGIWSSFLILGDYDHPLYQSNLPPELALHAGSMMFSQMEFLHAAKILRHRIPDWLLQDLKASRESPMKATALAAQHSDSGSDSSEEPAISPERLLLLMMRKSFLAQLGD
jgi:hypothetical protein